MSRTFQDSKTEVALSDGPIRKPGHRFDPEGSRKSPVLATFVDAHVVPEKFDGAQPACSSASFW
jgi:hypothetical protein